MLNNINPLKINFADEISSLVFERGETYYQQKRVTIVSADYDRVNAIVRGSKNYRVIIIIDKRGDFNGTCNCPHSLKICKHIAATLIHISESQRPNSSNSNIKNDLIKTLGSNYKNRKIFSYQANMITQKFMEFAQSLDINNQEQLFQEINFYLDLYLNLNSSFSKDCNFNIAQSIEKHLQILLSNDSNYQYLLRKISKINNKTQEFINFILPYFIQALNNVQNADKLLNYFINFNSMLNIDNKKSVITTLYQYLEKSKLLKEILLRSNDPIETTKIILSVIDNNPDKQELVLLIEKHFIDDFITTEGMKILQKLYSETGKDFNNLYLKIIEKKFETYPTIEDYKILKTIYSEEEWLKIKDKYIAKFKSENNLITIYILEKHFEKVLTLIKNTNDLKILNTNKTLLYKNLPEQTVKLYRYFIINTLNEQHTYNNNSSELFEVLYKLTKDKEIIINLLKETSVLIFDNYYLLQKITVFLMRNNINYKFKDNEENIFEFNEIIS